MINTTKQVFNTKCKYKKANLTAGDVSRKSVYR